MEAKLIKEEDIYYLSIDNKLIGSTYPKLPKDIPYKLSLKNCQAIERGYDLDELANKAADVIHAKRHVGEEWSTAYAGFHTDFQKALSILGDKKFNEEDMRNAWDAALNQYLMFHEIPATAWREQYIQSLQQNEWDVEICCHIDDHGTGNGSEDSFSHPMFTNTGIPKLDADCHLILKRK